jgi:hypothetical protein
VIPQRNNKQTWCLTPTKPVFNTNQTPVVLNHQISRQLYTATFVPKELYVAL